MNLYLFSKCSSTIYHFWIFIQCKLKKYQFAGIFLFANFVLEAFDYRFAPFFFLQQHKMTHTKTKQKMITPPIAMRRY